MNLENGPLVVIPEPIRWVSVVDIVCT